MDSAQLADALARGVRMERPLGPQVVFPWGMWVGISNFLQICVRMKRLFFFEIVKRHRWFLERIFLLTPRWLERLGH